MYSTENWGDFIKDKVTLSEHIQKFETLKDNGNGKWRGAHTSQGHSNDDNTRLSVDDNDGLYNCFSCRESGSIIDWEMNRLNCDFIEACESIAQQYQLELPKQNWSPEQKAAYNRQREINTSTKELLNLAANHFHSQLSPESIAYLTGRGITEETIKVQRIGYAPKDDALKSLLYKHIKTALPELPDTEIREHILNTGLYKEKESKLSPVFRERYVFPYLLNKEQVGFFIGRNAQSEDFYMQNGKKIGIPKYKKLQTQGANGDLPVKAFHKLYGSHNLKCNDPRPILITEGIVDAILAEQELFDKYQVLSPCTVGFNNSDIQEIVNMFWDWNDSYITLIFCNDTERNNAGKNGALATCEKIEDAWNVRVESEKQACKDNDSEPPKRPTLLLKIATLPCPPECDNVDLADYISQGRTAELLYWLEAAQSLWYENARKQGNMQRFFAGKSQSAIKPKLVADEIRQAGRYFLKPGSRLHEYQGGVYNDRENEIKRDIQRLLHEASTPTHVNSVLKQLSTETHYDLEKAFYEATEDTEQLINCQNGILNPKTGELSPHSPYTKSFIQINAKWDPKAQCPSIDKFLSEVLPEDTLPVVEEAIGYTLLQTNRYEKAILFSGSGRNGKGTFLNLIRRFIGVKNCSARTLKDLTNPYNRFATYSLFGKLANICGDLSSGKLQDTNNFKMFTSRDLINAEDKGKTGFKFENFATMWFSCNQLPLSDDRSEGFYERWIILPFGLTVPKGERDTNLIDKLTTETELSGLFNKAVAGLLRLRETGSFTESPSVSRALAEYQIENDNILRFIQEEVTIDRTLTANESCTKTELFETFLNWCLAERINSDVSKKDFGRAINNSGCTPKQERGKEPRNKNRKYVWLNLSVEHSEYAPINEEDGVGFRNTYK